jgi:hypothetical protein
MTSAAGTRSRSPAIKNPAELPHKELGVDIAFECTGLFTSKEKAAAHLTAGAKRVLVSAPADGADKTIVYKVNHETLTGRHRRLQRQLHHQLPGPVAKVLNDLFGIERGYMTTIHAYTGDQPTLDTMHKRPLSRPRGGAVHDPDLDRRGQGARPGAAGTEGQAGRLLDPRPDPQRLAGRPEGRRQARHQRRRKSTTPSRAPRWAR